MKRKQFISTAFLSTAGLTLVDNLFARNHYNNPFESDSRLGRSNERMKVCVFSKQLQWLNYTDMAEAVAEMGYDGIDLTVRAKGHVLPERVETDLPMAVEAARKAGIKIMMISTDINDAEEPKTEKILKTAAANGIHFYRTNGINYKNDLEMPANLEKIKKNFIGLAALNEKYGLNSFYLNHSGEGFGSSIWDLWYAIKDLDSRFIGSQYDIKHASIAAPYSWTTGFKLIHNFIQSMVVRDFSWENNGGAWGVKSMPIGDGLVDFKKFFDLVKQYRIPGPLCVMCDYNLGGAENGAMTLTIPGKSVLDAMKKDLLKLKVYLESADL